MHLDSQAVGSLQLFTWFASSFLLSLCSNFNLLLRFFLPHPIKKSNPSFTFRIFLLCLPCFIFLQVSYFPLNYNLVACLFLCISVLPIKKNPLVLLLFCVVSYFILLSSPRHNIVLITLLSSSRHIVSTQYIFVWLVHNSPKCIVSKIITKIFSFNVEPEQLSSILLRTEKRNICN